MKFLKKHWLAATLTVILVAAFVLRIWDLTKTPGSMYWEEVALGYDAYSILQTGKDYHGNSFPLVAFPSFGDYKPSLYFYTIVPFLKIFGLTPFAVRFPSVLAGVGTVFLVFLIGRQLFGEKVGLFAAGVYVIQPWNLFISRIGFETNLATFLITLGLYFLVKARNNARYLVAAACVLTLSMYAYHAARIVSPLLGVICGVVLLIQQKKKRKEYLVSCALAVGASLLIALPILLNLRNLEVTQRAAETSIFSDLGPIEESNMLRERDGYSLMSRLIYHRYMLFAREILHGYFQNFSFNFLFLEGDENARHQVKEFGVLYYWEAITVLVGFFVLLRERKSWFWLIPTWIAIAGIAPAVTTVSPHTLRFLSAAPAFALLSGLGLFQVIIFVRSLKKPFRVAALGIVVLVISGCFFAYIHFLFAHYYRLNARDWQGGYQELYRSLESLRQKDEPVFVTREQGRPSIYYLWFTKQDPRVVQQTDATAPKDQQELLRVGQYSFVDVVPTEHGALIASSPKKRAPNSEVLDSIALPNGETMWEIWRLK